MLVTRPIGSLGRQKTASRWAYARSSLPSPGSQTSRWQLCEAFTNLYLKSRSKWSHRVRPRFPWRRCITAVNFGSGFPSNCIAPWPCRPRNRVCPIKAGQLQTGDLMVEFLMANGFIGAWPVFLRFTGTRRTPRKLGAMPPGSKQTCRNPVGQPGTRRQDEVPSMRDSHPDSCSGWWSHRINAANWWWSSRTTWPKPRGPNGTRTQLMSNVVQATPNPSRYPARYQPAWKCLPPSLIHLHQEDDELSDGFTHAAAALCNPLKAIYRFCGMKYAVIP